jgi:hypothetical protein
MTDARHGTTGNDCEAIESKSPQSFATMTVHQAQPTGSGQEEESPSGAGGAVVAAVEPLRAARSPRRLVDKLAGPITVGVAATLVASVIGAVPWRQPTMLVEDMFRGFTACARVDGYISPLVMRCGLAGVPVGMYQLDGGISYSLAWLFDGLGIDNMAAWKLSVWLLLVVGFGAFYWLARRLASAPVAVAVTLVYSLSSSLTARSWNWYWCPMAVALLPLVLASCYQVIEHARERRLDRLTWPWLGACAAAVVVGLEWQYAGVLATSVLALTALVVLAQRGWTMRSRVVGGAAAATSLLLIAGIMWWRLHVAGVVAQYSTTDAVQETSVDVASLVLPDGRRSFFGAVLRGIGLDRLLVGHYADDAHLWPGPYLGLITITVLMAFVLYNRRQVRIRWPLFATVLAAVVGASVLLSLGSHLQLSKDLLPGGQIPLPWSRLWSVAPLHWMRYPWTWIPLAHVAALLLIAALAPRWRRGGPRANVGLIALCAVMLLEYGSPGVLRALVDSKPSVSTAPAGLRVSTADDAVARFESRGITELQSRLSKVDGVVAFLPWGNHWTVPHLGPEMGVSVRNVGIDRNVRQVEAAAPFTRDELRSPSADLVRNMLSSGWVDAVVLLDHWAEGDGVIRSARGDPSGGQRQWLRQKGMIERSLRDSGICIERFSWFSVATIVTGTEQSGRGCPR